MFFDRVRSVPGVSVDRKKRVEGRAERVVMGLRLRNNSEDEDLNEFFGDNSNSEADEAAEALPTSRQKTEKTINEGEDGERESVFSGKIEGVITCASSASGASPQDPTPPLIEAPLADAKTPMERVAEALHSFGVKGATVEEIADRAGLSVDETRKRLEAVQRDRHTFTLPGGLVWRWVS